MPASSLLVVALLGPLAPVQTPFPILPLSEVRPGQKGWGLTVFTTPTVERFNFEVLGIERNIFPKKDVIWVMLTDDKLRHYGVVNGMSGSPLYVDGKLMGALAYGYSFSKDPIAGITPIEQMLEIPVALKNAGPPQNGGGGPREGGGGRIQLEPFGVPGDDELRTPRRALERLLPALGNVPGRLPLRAAQGPVMLGTPLAFSGLDPRVLERFAPFFETAGLVPMAGGGGGGAAGEPLDYPWEAGSPVAGLLMDGDLLAAATGTLTCRLGDVILAFGHPFLSSGQMELPMSRAQVLFTMTNLSSSFKVSNAGAPEGTIRFDHQNGILGVIGPPPRMVPVTVGLALNGETRNQYRYRVFHHKDFSGSLVALGVAQSASGLGPESAEITLEIRAEIGLRGRGPVRVRNLYTGEFAPTLAGAQASQAVNALVGNPFEPTVVEDVKVELRATMGLKQSTIAGVSYDRSEVKPGEELGITVRLRPYRGPIEEKRLTVPIPADLAEGQLQVLVGGAGPITAEERRLSPGRFLVQNLDQIIERVSEIRANDRVYVRVLARQTGAIVRGTELEELPPSALTVLTAPRSRGEAIPALDRLLGEYSIPCDFTVNGLDRYQLQVTR
jgi:hypothetical protein